jgi:deoxyribose-phosphate aldolase
VLKVIVETCLLTEAEKIEMCGVVSRAGADYIKTSTGFSAGGATREDVALFRKHLAPGVRIKASAASGRSGTLPTISLWAPTGSGPRFW